MFSAGDTSIFLFFCILVIGLLLGSSLPEVPYIVNEECARGLPWAAGVVCPADS